MCIKSEVLEETMKLAYLLENIQYECIQGNAGIIDTEVEDVVYDSRKVTEGCLFICIEGANFDGHKFAQDAVKMGAAVLVVSKPVPELKDMRTTAGKAVTVIKVENTRYAMAFISAAYFGHPAEKLKVIGVTGTKGKTTTTYLIKSILENAGHRVGLVGTIETIIGDTHIHAQNTTPESFLLQEYFAKMVEEGLDSVVMEVSSQALKLHRTQGFVFDYGIFTNLEPDHIGPNEHDSFEDYMACKALLFKQCRVGIVNGDDAHWKQVTQDNTCDELETFGLNNENMLRGEDIELVHKPGELGVSFNVRGLMNFAVEVPTPGKFSVYNALAAIAICRHFNVEAEAVKNALLKAKVKGRIEMVKVSDEFTLLIDYAHNAMALESLLSTLCEYNPHRLVCLFGCGGNRSRQRRFEMGEISGKLADFTIITSDNPRFEEPQAIIDDIKTGINKTAGSYIEIIDRKEAIRYAIKNGEPGDIIILAGKGHEDYQEIKGVKHPMDERVLIEEILREEGN
jgi:UDP-N-acetylmuramoyl-L-alanyl-D-glutamate--2,6-diaminopimelate ligase